MNISAGSQGIKKIMVALRIAAYLLAVALVFWAVSVLCQANLILVRSTEPGVTDFAGFDFASAIAVVATESTDSIFMYPGAFYMPEDFASGSVTQEGVLYRRQPGGQGEYGTLRMVLKLPPNEAYAIAGKSVSYAQRLYIDGKEYAPIGTPGDSIETVTPAGRRFIEGFTPTGDTTEIIFHYSAFVHSDGGGLYPMFVGLVRNVARAEQLGILRDAAVAMTLMTAALFFFGLHLFSPKGRLLLWFALACACISLRTSANVMMLLLPNLNWYFAIRLEYIMTCGMTLFSVLYLNGLFPGASNRWAMRGFVLFCAANALYICLAPPVIFTRYAVAFGLAYAAFGVYLLAAIIAALIRKKITSPLSRTEQWILLFGLFVYAVFSAAGVWAHQWAVVIMGLDYPVVGMMIFLFLNILALALGFTRTERELHEARRGELETAETNRLLARLNRVKSEFLDNISHEMKTPLTIMGGYAGVALKQIEMNAVNDKTPEILDIVQHEALRLGRMVERLKEVAMEKERQLTLTDTDAGTLFGRAADACAPLCRANTNRIAVKSGMGTIPLRVEADGIHQVLLNLIGNANRHTRGGVITLSAEREPDDSAVTITVSDTGEGIDPALMATIFDRDVSGGGGTGLGLSICKEIVEEHGGKIYLHSEKGKGTTVRFTLPNNKEA
jgi:signal transduction histidine kinase